MMDLILSRVVEEYNVSFIKPIILDIHVLCSQKSLLTKRAMFTIIADILVIKWSWHTVCHSYVNFNVTLTSRSAAHHISLISVQIYS